MTTQVFDQLVYQIISFLVAMCVTLAGIVRARDIKSIEQRFNEIKTSKQHFERIALKNEAAIKSVEISIAVSARQLHSLETQTDRDITEIKRSIGEIHNQLESMQSIMGNLNVSVVSLTNVLKNKGVLLP